MKQVHLSDPEAVGLACDVLRGPAPVFMLQMPTVFALVAAPTSRGVAALNQCKRRLPGKTYGSLIGRIDAFRALAQSDALPQALQGPGALDCFEGAFMRVSVAPEHMNTPTVHGGTHQGLLMRGPHRAFFEALEAHCASQAEPALFCGHSYTAPLGSSANLSGDPLGSITEWARARELAVARAVSLVVRCEPAVGPAGSFPVFRLRPHQVTLERSGPGDAQIRARLPAHLQVL